MRKSTWDLPDSHKELSEAIQTRFLNRTQESIEKEKLFLKLFFQTFLSEKIFWNERLSCFILLRWNFVEQKVWPKSKIRCEVQIDIHGKTMKNNEQYLSMRYLFKTLREKKTLFNNFVQETVIAQRQSELVRKEKLQSHSQSWIRLLWKSKKLRTVEDNRKWWEKKKLQSHYLLTEDKLRRTNHSRSSLQSQSLPLFWRVKEPQ